MGSPSSGLRWSGECDRIDPMRGVDKPGRKAKRFLSALEKYEIWLQLIRQEVTMAEAAVRWEVDRSTIMRIRTVAKQGARAQQRDFELEAVWARANPHADELDAGTPFNWRMYLGFASRTWREFENPSESIAGDINHCPVRIDGEPEIPWEDVQPYNRSSRCLPRASEDDPWVGNEIVGQTLRDGGMTDVAAHLTTKLLREGAGSLALALLAPTGNTAPCEWTKATSPPRWPKRSPDTA